MPGNAGCFRCCRGAPVQQQPQARQRGFGGASAQVHQVGHGFGVEETNSTLQLGQHQHQPAGVGSGHARFQQVVRQRRRGARGQPGGAVAATRERHAKTQRQRDMTGFDTGQRQRLGKAAVHQQPVTDALRREQKGQSHAGAQRIDHAALRQQHRSTVQRVGGLDAQRQWQVFDVQVAEGLKQALADQPVVAQRELLTKAGQARQRHFEQRAVAALAGDVARPQPGGHLGGASRGVAGGDDGAEDRARAAADDGRRQQAFAFQHVHHAQAGDALHAPAAEHQRVPGGFKVDHGGAPCSQ